MSVIVLDVLQLVKCQTSSSNMQTKKWKDSLLLLFIM